MLNNFIYAETKNLFLEHLNSGNILDEAIVFIADTKEIWNHGTYFAGDCGFDQNTIDLIQAAISDIELNKLDKITAEGLYATKAELPNLELYVTKEEADIKYASASDVEGIQSQLENNFATKEFVETEIEKSKSKTSSIPITEDLFIFEKEEGTERNRMMAGHVQESRLQEVLSAETLDLEGCILSKKHEPLFSSYTVFAGTFLFGVMDEANVTVMISEDGQFLFTMSLLNKNGDFSASASDEVEIDNDSKDVFRQNFGFLYELGSHMFEEQSLPLYNDDSRTLTEEYRDIAYNCLGLKIENNEFIRIAKYDNYSVFQLIWTSGISESDSTTIVIETLLVYKNGGVTRQRRTVVNDNRITNAISNSVTFTDSEKQNFKENFGITNNEGGLKVFELTEDKIESLNDEEQKIILKSEYAETAYNSDAINISGEAIVFKAINISEDVRLFFGSARVTSSEAILFVAYVSMTGEISTVNAAEKYPFVYEGGDDGKVQRRLTLLDLSLPYDSNKEYTAHLDEVIVNVKKNLGIEEVKSTQPLIEITYSELKTLRDNSQLVPGQQYCITNYVTTTTQENTQSAGHQFDIIVTADSTDTLNENARAIQHTTGESDYFHNSDLASWELKYCLDNDTTRFTWAKSDGKGVIYYMKDEFGNECPYDFKNIRFKHPLDTTTYSGYYYTFTNLIDTTIKDKSVIKRYCYNNVIENCYNEGVLTLNNIVFINTAEDGACYSNVFGTGCFSNAFGNECFSNVFGVNCYNNKFSSTCYYNTFGNQCYNNTFGNSCYCNKLGAYTYSSIFGDYCYFNELGQYCGENVLTYNCYCNKIGDYSYQNGMGSACGYNTLGTYCNYNGMGDSCALNIIGDCAQSNSFGNSCSYNVFGEYCAYNVFSNSCSYNKFANSCDSNQFGEGCDSNTFGNVTCSNILGSNCNANTLGNYCHTITMGAECNTNVFGNDCNNIKFGGNCTGNKIENECKYITFGASSDVAKSFYKYITIEAGNQYIYLNCTSSTSYNSPYRNVRIGLGVNNINLYKTITDSNVGQTYETYYKPANSQTITI